MKFSIRNWISICGLGAVVAMTPRSAAETVQVSTNLTGTVIWSSTNEYVLNGFTYVLSNAVLNIEPGTVIRGKAGTGLTSAALFITQGAKIYANGTRSKPIIFTAEEDDLTDPNDIPLNTRGLWGGVVIFGKSVLNTSSDVTGNAAAPKYDVFEGLPDSQVEGQFVNRFGGNDDDDNSGVFRYVSIRYPGTVILPNKEINGLSLCAVGRGTTIENVEVYGAADDSVEFFGGTVNTKYMVSVWSDDDNFDIDQGYRGKNQFWFAIQSPDKKDSGGEWNGEPNGLATGAAPIGNYEIYNATWIGAGTNTTGNRALQIREYAAPKVFNSIITEYAGPAVRIDVRAAAHFTNGVAQIKDNLWWNFATNGVAVPLAESGTADTSDYGQVLFSDASLDNVVADPMLRGISRTNAPAFGLDPRPQPGSPALTSSRTAPNDGFYTPVAYKGAFNTVNWASDWTAAGEMGLMTAVGAGTPGAPAEGNPLPKEPTLTAQLASGALVITFGSEAGRSYQIQSKSDVGAVAWTDEGAAIAGTGSPLTQTIAISGSGKFFRVVVQ
ncbi:MAG: T9SS C-terminal target domain-containing protein [Verrucomicrobiota bacterium]